MAPLPQYQPSYADSRIIDSRQALPEAVAAALRPRKPTAKPLPQPPPLSPEELTLRLLLSPRAPKYHSDNTLAARQSGIYPIEEQYQGLNSGPAPGTVVGIVLGSVAGFLILLWLLYTISSGGTFIKTTGDVEEVETVRRRSRSPRERRTRSRRTEVVSDSASPAPPRRVYRSERIVRDLPPERSRSPPVMRERERSRMRETVIVDEVRQDRRVDGDNIIEVTEEHSSIDAPRRKNRRSSRSVVVERVVDLDGEEEQAYEVDDRRVSGAYRTVDPRQLGGGSFRRHRV